MRYGDQTTIETDVKPSRLWSSYVTTTEFCYHVARFSSRDHGTHFKIMSNGLAKVKHQCV